MNKLAIVLYCHTLFFKKDADMGKDTFIILAFFIAEEKTFFRKLQLFSQKTDVLHFPDGFWIHQRTIDEYNNLQIPKRK